MSILGDVEEGEVDDISDFEDNGSCPTHSPSNEGLQFINNSSFHNGTSGGYEVDGSNGHSKRHSIGVRTDKVATLVRESEATSLLQYLSEEEMSQPKKPKLLKAVDMRKKKKRKRERTVVVRRAPLKKVEKPRCRYFLEGRCNKGAACPFSHDFQPPKRQELCKFYAVGNCSRGSACSFLHGEFPCKFFHLNNKCYHRDTCKFSHDPLTSWSRSLLTRVASDKPASDADMRTRTAPLRVDQPLSDTDYRFDPPRAPFGGPCVLPRPTMMPPFSAPYEGPPRFPGHPYAQGFPNPPLQQIPNGPQVEQFHSAPPCLQPHFRTPFGPEPNILKHSLTMCYSNTPDTTTTLVQGNGGELPVVPPLTGLLSVDKMPEVSFTVLGCSSIALPNGIKNGWDNSEPELQRASDETQLETEPSPDSPSCGVSCRTDLIVREDFVLSSSTDMESSELAVNWRLIPLEFDEQTIHSSVPSSAQHSTDPRLKTKLPADPRLKNVTARAALHSHLTATVEKSDKPQVGADCAPLPKTADVTVKTETSGSRRPVKLQLNEMANNFSSATVAPYTSTPASRSYLIDPRFRRRRITPPTATETLKES